MSFGLGRLGAGFGRMGAGGAGGPPSWVLRGGGQPAVIDMDFAGGRYWGGGLADLPCSRAATGFGQTSGGALISFAVNVLRITDLGLLIEELRANGAVRSQQFENASWSKTGCTATADQATAPDGTLTADLQTQSVAGGTFRQSFTGSVSTTYTVSTYFKPGTATYGLVYIGDGGVGGADSGYAVHLTTGALVKVGAGSITATATQVAGGFWRLAVTFTTSGADNTFDVIVRGQDAAPVETTAVTIYPWGAQIEPGAFPTSYAPTTTVPFTRALDNISATAALLNVLKGAAGTIIIRTNGFQAARAAALLGVGSSAAVGLQFTAANKLQTGWGTGTLLSGNTATLTGRVKVGLRWNAAGRSICLNGGTIASDANAPDAITAANLGVLSDGTLAACGLFERVTAFSSVISDAAFQSLTT